MPTIVNGKVTYQPGEALPVQGSAEFNQSIANPQAFVSSYVPPAPKAITPESLTPARAVSVTDPKPATGYASLGGVINNQATNFETQAKAELDRKAQMDAERFKLESTRQTLKDRILGGKTESGLKAEAYKETVDPIKSELTEINTKIRNEQVALQREIEALDQTFQGSPQGRVDAIQSAERKSLRKQADLAIVQLAVQGRYEDAKATADRAIDAELEQQRNELEVLKFDYEENKELFDKEDQREYEKYIKENEREYAKKESDRKAISDLSIDALQKGAPTSVASQMRAAETVEEAIKLGGKYLGVKTYKELPDGRAVMMDAAGNIVSVLSNGKPKITGETFTLTPEQRKDPFIQKLANSAGGKPITDTFAQQLSKGLTVLGQVGTLQANIKDTNTGPIAGAFRGANPWDTNAQTIRAQLNAVVPNLARGVYGEVGVLTDNDIKTYASTLPNLKSTEDIRNAVLGITVDLIGKSIKRNLEINAANGKDVSGFIDIYTEMQSTRDSIFSQIPGYKGSLSANNNPFAQAMGGGQSIINSSGGYNIPN
jgi:hypothetical protein